VKSYRLTDPLLHTALGLLPRKRQGSGLFIVSAGGLGDTVLFSLVLPRFMALAEPGEKVTVALRSDAAAMAFLFPPEVEVISVDFSRLRQPLYRLSLARDLRRRHFRMAITADYLRHPELDEALIAFAGATEAAAMVARPWKKHDRKLARNRALFHRLYESGPPVQDKILRWTRFAEWLSGQPAKPLTVQLDPSRLPPPAVVERPFVLLQPFSAVKAKQSPLSTWEALIDSLPPGMDVVVAGHPKDLERNPQFRVLFERPNVHFNDAPFRALLPLLRAASTVVSVDTACMHLSCAAGVPTLCLASAAYVGEIVPYAAEITPPNVQVLWMDRECRSCLGVCRQPLENGIYPCVAAIRPADVIATVAAMLRGDLAQANDETALRESA